MKGNDFFNLKVLKYFMTSNNVVVRTEAKLMMKGGLKKKYEIRKRLNREINELIFVFYP